MAKINKEDAIQWYAQNRGIYKKLSEKIQNIIAEIIEVSDIAVHGINCRTKEVDSFKGKIEKSKYDDPLNQITDFSGIRIIAYVENDIKPICQIIENTFDIDVENSADKSDMLGTDKVGYKSIHYIAKIKSNRLNLPEYKKFKNLKFEIQIRTILQHAWAEIEHDRNYKFNGVLPPEIKRRFGLLAAALESADREFNQLSLEIDKISEDVSIADEKDELNKILLNSTTLKQFLTNRFQTEITNAIVIPDFYTGDDELIDELKIYGIQNLEHLNNIVPKDFAKNIRKIYNKNKATTFFGIVRDFMIINNADKYFGESWRNSWNGLDPESMDLYKLYTIDVDHLMEKYQLVST
jgi:putative GTP pyrophosphokinase